MGEEIWRRNPEFDFIEGSSLGRVRTLGRVLSRGRGTYVVKGKILKQQRTNKGYLRVTFSMDGKTVTRKVHRIIAQTFIPNPDNLPQVNHKDCDRTNNSVDNLEWCTASYNRQYTEKHGRALRRSLWAVNLKTQEVSWFQSQHEASQVIGVSCGGVNNVLKGRRNHTGGYWFTYADHNAVDNTRLKFGNYVASKVEHLVNENN